MLLLLNIFLGLSILSRSCHAQSPSRKPNFVFIITDDQDVHLNSLDYQPYLKKHFADEGTYFSRHYCTVSVCCPSRVSLLTGRAAHNTNVTAIQAPYGGYTKFISGGWNDKYLPVFLQEGGYNTYYTGKLMNDLTILTYNNPYTNGWNGSDFLLDPGTYIYYNSTTQRNKSPPRTNPGIYSTDIVASNAVGFLDEALLAGDNRPFFLGVAPVGPHSETLSPFVTGKPGPISFDPPVPAKRHKHLFPDIKVPRKPNFNPDVPSSASYIKSLQKLNSTQIEYNDNWYRRRIQALQAVDELVDSIMDWMHAHPDILNNTYIIYTSDNGYHIGQHRLAPGKSCGIEEDINVPFFIRGPGVEKGKNYDGPTTHTDILPTIFELAGLPLQDEFDGEPMPITKNLSALEKSEHVNVEFWGFNVLEGDYPGNGTGLYATDRIQGGYVGLNNTYKTLRIIGVGYNLMYTVWCTNEHELYDMGQSDPYQMNNLYNTTGDVGEWTVQTLEARLDTLLLTLKTCKGKVCTRPWDVIHPEGNVRNLKDAMKAEYNIFYMEQQPKVSFGACALGYLTQYEGPMEPSIYHSDAQYGRGVNY
ncbi:arylsulfatase precursor [Whalleya microplaca]|nr:arylsulfatase precursor [Whalleya microplaca]